MRAKILSASAGSGKTYSLAYKFIHDTIKYFKTKPYLYRAILAVTFTNKATEQMKSRILKELGNLSRYPDKSNYMADLKRDLGLSDEEIIRRAELTQQRILHDYSRFTILTIDKFFQRILRAFLKELGFDLNYAIELNQDALLQQSVDSLIEDSANDEDLLKWIEGFLQESLDEGEKWDIRAIIKKWEKGIFNEKGKLAIENSVSKEKLQELMQKLLQNIAKISSEQQAVGKRALQMMDAAGVEPDDFKGKASGFISLFAKSMSGKEFNLTSTMVNNSYSTAEWSKVPAAQVLATELFPLYVELCDLCRRKTKAEQSLKLFRKTYRTYAMLRDIYRKLRERSDEEGIMLLSETKYILSRFIEDNDTPFIYEKMGNRFERFMIDEFQDTSLKEWHNFVPMLRNAMAQSEDESVLIVGDVKQSIYRWRGGDWRILKEYVKQDLGQDDTIEVPMDKNWRSLKQVVEFNNDTIRDVVNLVNGTLNDMLDKAIQEKSISAACNDELHDMLLSAYRELKQQPCRKSKKSGYVRVEQYDQDVPPMIEYIESAIARGYSYNDILILCRTKDDGALAAKVLMEYKRHNNTFNIMTRDSLSVGRGAVSSFVIAVMRLSQNPDDVINLAVMNDYLGRAYDAPAEDSDLATLSAISQLSPEQAFERIVIDYGLDKNVEEIAYVQALHEQIVAFCSSKSADIQLFLKMWDEDGYKQTINVEQNKDTIELTTIHKAKGLERKVVIIPYCDWPLKPYSGIVWAQPNVQSKNFAELGCFPVNYQKEGMSVSDFSEEYYREMVFNVVEGINILYVALTRAEEELYVCIPYTPPKEIDDKKKKSKKDGSSVPDVGKYLWEAVQDKAQTEDVGGSKRIWAEFGVQEAPESRDDKAEQVENILLDIYPTYPTTQSPRTVSQRYFEEDGESVRSARNMGILMHGVLSEAKDKTDVMRRIDLEQKNGHLSDEQALDLKQIIEREFCHDQVREWFGAWDEVRTESDILSADIVGTRRPDRVMIRGNRAVVVDYKFGDEQRATHHRQVAAYAQLLRQMGYAEIEGYVWYLSLGQIVKVDCNELAL